VMAYKTEKKGIMLVFNTATILRFTTELACKRLDSNHSKYIRAIEVAFYSIRQDKLTYICSEYFCPKHLYALVVKSIKKLHRSDITPFKPHPPGVSSIAPRQCVFCNEPNADSSSYYVKVNTLTDFTALCSILSPTLSKTLQDHENEITIYHLSACAKHLSPFLTPQAFISLLKKDRH
jgi:hypothetical protein